MIEPANYMGLHLLTYFLESGVSSLMSQMKIFSSVHQKDFPFLLFQVEAYTQRAFERILGEGCSVAFAQGLTRYGWQVQCCLLLYGLRAKSGFYVFLNGEKKIKRRIFYGIWELQEAQNSVSLNKVLPEHRQHTHLFMAFATTVAELSSPNFMPIKPKIFTLKKFVNFCLSR